MWRKSENGVIMSKGWKIRAMLWLENAKQMLSSVLHFLFFFHDLTAHQKSSSSYHRHGHKTIKNMAIKTIKLRQYLLKLCFVLWENQLLFNMYSWINTLMNMYSRINTTYKHVHRRKWQILLNIVTEIGIIINNKTIRMILDPHDQPTFFNYWLVMQCAP